MTDGVWMDSDILFDANGSAGNPITLKAQNPGQVVLSGLTKFRIATVNNLQMYPTED